MMLAATEIPKAPLRTRNHLSSAAAVIVGVAVIAVLIFTVLHFGDVEAFADMFRRARPVWLVAALAFQACTYVSVSLAWRAVLVKSGAPHPMRRLIPIAISKLSPIR
jgi:uncharacterized membrane protein YbhN (UPF0104 family)